MSNSTPQPGTYAKGDDVKVANTPAKAVALAFAGYKPVSDDAAESASAETATGPSSTSATPDAPSGTPVTAVPRPPAGARATTTTP